MNRLAAGALLLLAACAAPGPPMPAVRQDPRHFESCADAAGQTAWEQAQGHLQAGRDSDALPLLRQVVELCPDHVVALAHYQDTALHLGGEAETSMRQYYAQLGDDPASPVPAFAKARLLASNFARKAAVDALLTRHGDFAWAWLAQARLNRSVGRLHDAADGFGRAIASHPGLLPAHLELAETLVELGRFGEARLPYENYLRRAPNDRDAIAALVQLLLYQLGEPGDAKPWIERLLADDPHDEAARTNLAAADWRTGDLDRALAGYLAVLAQRPDNARAALNIGYLHYDAFVRSEEDKQQHWPKARKAFLLFLRLVRPEDGHDYFERVLAVPFRLKEIEALLGPADAAEPTLDDLK